MELGPGISAVVTGGASGLGEATALAIAMIENGYLNGECVRLDGAIRMAPR